MIKEIFLIFFAFCVRFSFEQTDVIGCGGFIKSETDINYKVVRIQLITTDGIPIYTTEAAPNNGYYMIPVYERGEYLLKLLPPLGWSFEPTQIELNIDGENDPCTLNHDINFVFKGFGLAGRVISAGSSSIHGGGPAGVTLSLFHENKKLNETKSKADGTFEFFDVLPGHYTVKGTHPHWKFLIDSSDVQLSKERWEIEQPIVVRGYSLKGNVVHQSSPLISIDVFLFRTTNDENQANRPTCSNDGPLKSNEIQLLPSTIKKENFLCRTRTNVKGEFQFDDVPVAVYSVFPLYSTSTIEMNFLPEIKSVTISHKDFQIETPFETGTISFFARVVKSKKSADEFVPLANVQISLNGKFCCQTDAEGRFKLTQIRPTGTISVTAKLDGYEFTEYSHSIHLNRLIGMSENSVAFHLFPSKIRVSGRVQCSSTRKQTIRYVDKEKKINGRIEVEPNSEYQIYLPVGFYTFSPELSDVDVRAGVHLTPEEIDVDLSSASPIDQINFSQLKAKLTGVIHCIENCQNDLPILELTSRSGVVQRINLIPNPSKTTEIHFEEDHLLPGKYSIALIKSKSNDKYCWKESQIDVDLSNANKTIQFDQIGLKLRVQLQTSNKVLLKLNQIKENHFTNSIELLSGFNEICLPNHGQYELMPTSCMKFENEKYFYDTSKSSTIELIPTEYQVFVTIQSDQDDSTGDTFPILIRNSKTNNEFSLDLQKEKNKWTNSFWAKNNEQFIVFPRSDIWLFEPEHQSITISSDTCQSNQVKFVARRGLFIDGSTNPPVSNANVSLYRSSMKNDVESPVDIDGQSMILLSSAFTDADGKYHFGPLSNSNSYKIVLHKTGHVFTRQSNSQFDFNSEKLASIRVKIDDVDGVFLLLTSSTSSMRRRTATTDSTGQVEFTDLQSADYYLRPQLREYQFEPEDAQIQLKSGDDVQIEFRPRRTSFSCFGQITSINNEAEANLIVDATPVEKCENLPKESAKTDVNGQFRLRALQPNCRYRLQYRSNPSDSNQNEILTLEPRNFFIDIQQGDVENVHLYTIKRSSDVDLNVFIQTPTQFLNQLKVKLFKSSSQRETLVQTITLTNSPFAYFNSLPLDNESYTLKVESPLSTSVYHFVQPELTFTANQTFLFFNFQFEPRLKIYDGETGLTGSYSAFIIALLIIAFVFKHETILPWLRSFYTYLRQVFIPNLIHRSSNVYPTASTNDQNGENLSSTSSETKRRVRVAD